MKCNKDLEWIKKCIDESENYKIYVDNDDIFVVKITEEDPEGMDGDMYHFNDFGEDFILLLLRGLGINADFV